MITKKFTIKEAYKDGWNNTKKHWKIALPTVLILMLIDSVLSSNDSMILSVVSLVFAIWTGYNMTKMFLNMHDGKQVEILDIFEHKGNTPKRVLQYFLTTLISVAAVFSGLILFIIPGLYLMCKYLPAIYNIVDKDIKALTAFKEAGKMTSGHMLQIFCMLVISIFVTAITFGLGAIPATFANIYMYRKLSHTTA
jgi:uncharacterized membrane protein